MAIPGERLQGSIAASELVAWYCGHPDVHPDPHPSKGGDPLGPPPRAQQHTGAREPSKGDDPLGPPPRAQQHTGAREPSKGGDPLGPPPRAQQHTGAPEVLDAATIEHLIATTSTAVVVGVGNVALDVARVLIKSAEQLSDTDMPDEVLDGLAGTRITDVHILGRRGPGVHVVHHQGAARDRSAGRSWRCGWTRPTWCSTSRARPAWRSTRWPPATWRCSPSGPSGPAGEGSRRIWWHFWTRPTALRGEARVSAVEVESTTIDADGRVVGTGAPTDPRGPAGGPVGGLSRTARCPALPSYDEVHRPGLPPRRGGGRQCGFCKWGVGGGWAWCEVDS
jgi:ferredoxin--NADP+ reductase